MNERLGRPEPLRQAKESVKEWLRDIGKRSRNPDLLDRIALPIDRQAAETLASMLDISPEEIAKIRDSE